MNEWFSFLQIDSPEKIEVLSELPTHARGDGMGFRSQHFD